jgi:hypothetical protein
MAQLQRIFRNGHPIHHGTMASAGGLGMKQIASVMLFSLLFLPGCPDEDADSSCDPPGSFATTYMPPAAGSEAVYQITVTDPQGEPCPIGALACVLAIGDSCFINCSTSADDTRTYPLTEEEWNQLEDGAPVTGWYGTCDNLPPVAEDCPQFGWLDKNQNFQ